MELEDVELIVGSVYKEHYHMHRKGAYDFPDEDEWVAEQVNQHKLNNPELYGYVWDEENQTWLLKFENGFSRMIDKTNKPI